MPAAVLDRLSIDDREKSWLSRLDDESQRTSVALREGEIVGWISFGPCRDEESDRFTAEVYAIYLDSHVWRRGIGSALWHHAVAAFRAQGFRQLIVWVLEKNVRARAFYEAVGGIREPAQRKEIEIGEKKLIEVPYRFDCEMSDVATGL